MIGVCSCGTTWVYVAYVLNQVRITKEFLVHWASGHNVKVDVFCKGTIEETASKLQAVGFVPKPL